MKPLPFDRAPAIISTSREQWLMLRRERLMGTEIAQILGFSERGGPADVWADKMGLRTDNETDAGLWGRFMQEGILRKYAQETGLQVAMAPEHSIWQHQGIPWLATSGDGETMLPEGRACVEAKSNASWWEEGIPPLDNRIQVQSQILCTSAAAGVIVGFVNRFSPTVHHTLTLDEGFWRSAMPVLEEFWGYVKRKELPDDPKWYTKSGVAAIWPEAKEGTFIELGENDLRIANRIERLKEFEKWVGLETEASKVALAVRLGDNEQGRLPDGSSYTLKTVNKEPSFCECGRETRKGSTFRQGRRFWPKHLRIAKKQLDKRRLIA